MRKHSYLKALALALPLAVTANGCILMPEVEKRVVDLAVSTSTVVPFVALGSVNFHDAANAIDLDLKVDLQSIFSDNDLSAENVTAVKVAGVSYRVTKAEANRTITGGTVEIKRGSTGETPSGAPPTTGYTPLVTAFNASAAATTDWITVDLNKPGVDVINDLLAELLAKAKGGPAVTTKYLTYHVYGVSGPTNIPTNFTWEFRIKLSIVGSFETDIVN